MNTLNNNNHVAKVAEWEMDKNKAIATNASITTKATTVNTAQNDHGDTSTHATAQTSF
jgi:hypothetical protein